MKIATEIVASVRRESLSSREVGLQFKSLTESGGKVVADGIAKRQPELLAGRRFSPQHKICLFEAQFYLTDIFQMPELRFFVAYVVLPNRSRRRQIFPRIWYKDLSLSWRSASHFAFETDGSLWIGKGSVQVRFEDGHEIGESMESTTDLPLEMQTGIDAILDVSKSHYKANTDILKWVLKQGGPNRVRPFSDFEKPRTIAAGFKTNLINRGRSIAKFRSQHDPESLVITPGFEPDFSRGVIEQAQSKSTLYGGKLQRFRILSSNRKIQYYFIAGPKQVWIIPPQALTMELSSFGVRTIDVIADDDLFIPGYEYHHTVETQNGVELYSQIPPGFAGEKCPFDEAKADASPWLDNIPVIREFRRTILN
jgi:hypothetical protein